MHTLSIHALNNIVSLQLSHWLLMTAILFVYQVDLKDKWRNLVRVAVSPAARSQGKGAKQRVLPLDILAKASLCLPRSC